MQENQASNETPEEIQDDGLKAQVLAALQQVIDPDLRRSIVELGFIKNLRACGGNVAFDIELTTPACPVREQMQQQAEEVVREIAGVEKVAITMTSQTRRPPQLQNMIPGIKNAVAIASGKGGVGKSTTAVNLAIALSQSGASVGLMDADIYGPSIPIMMGVPEGEQPEGEEYPDGTQRIYPLERCGIKLMSVGFLTEKGSPIIWRGPMIGKMIQTFLGSVVWGELDYLIIDLPPGTGDTHLTLMQSAPLSGAVIVTTPEAVALEDVMRAGRMFEKMAQVGSVVPILGIVENMSWYQTPEGERIELFGSGGGERAAKTFGVPLLGQVPRVLDITHGGDAGAPITASHPEHPISEIYRDIAGGVARRIATLSMQGASTFQEGRPLKTMDELKSE
jgi:ATP-binding protein involved in chromosome partitioning